MISTITKNQGNGTLSVEERRDIQRRSLARINIITKENELQTFKICRNCLQRKVSKEQDSFCPKCLAMEERRAEAAAEHRQQKSVLLTVLVFGFLIIVGFFWLFTKV